LCSRENRRRTEIYIKAAKCESGLGKWKINRMSKENMWNKYKTLSRQGGNGRREREILRIKV
jgi:hypothetical protein